MAISVKRPRTIDAKYLKLAEELKADVREGRLKPGGQLPTFVEMQRNHRVSRGTVERVLTLLESQDVVVRKPGAGVFVRSQKPRVEHSRTIGFYTHAEPSEMRSLYWSSILSGIRDQAALEGYSVMLVTDGDARTLDKIAGLLLLQEPEREHHILKSLPSGFPCVSAIWDYPDIASVIADDAEGIKDLVRHLLGLGHTRIGMVQLGRSAIIMNRMEAYKEAMFEAGIEPSLLWVRRRSAPRGSFFDELGRAAVNEWLENDWTRSPCTAVLVHNDAMAVGAIEAFAAAGLKTPEDVSITGFDGTDTFRYYTPSLMTVEVPLAEIGARAVQTLIQRLGAEEHEVQKIVLPTRLRIGQSTAPPAGLAVKGQDHREPDLDARRSAAPVAIGVR